MKHTEGEWSIIEKKSKFRISGEFWHDFAIVYKTKGDAINEEAEANAKLIAEAGTVTNETGYTPRQLAKQKAELLEALQGMYNITNQFHHPQIDLIRGAAMNAIKKATE